ncbi:Glycosyltransferase family GT7 [Gracilaria domingensis]|nr:Glycosyltransferase family GT7 [Gracilaria domingensis]
MPKTSRTTSSGTDSSKRVSHQRQRWLKQLQFILGPKVATRKNFVRLIAVLEALMIVFLYSKLAAKTYAIEELRSSSRESSWTQYGTGEESFGNSQKKSDINEKQVTAADALGTQSVSLTRRRFGLFGSSQECKPQPCSIDHWSPLEEVCFYRDDRAKDRRGHNATVWSLVQNEWYYTEASDFACPAVVCRKQWLREINLTKALTFSVLEGHYKNDTEWQLIDLIPGNIYVRINPFWGLEYKLNSWISLRKQNDTETAEISKKRASMTMRRGFTQKFCDVAMDDNILLDEEPVYVVVPYSGRTDMLRKFYANVRRLLDEGVNMRIILSIFGGQGHVDDAQLILDQLDLNITVGSLGEGNHIQIVQSPGDMRGNFSRAQALYEGTNHVPPEGLLFFCDVDVEIHKDFFDNCRYNTEKGHQVYYPVLYSLYPYGTTVSKEHGYWRSGAYGMVCVYNSDFRSRKAWDSELKRKVFIGWGGEDIALYSEFANVWQYTIFRSVEPNLWHRWHPQVCDFNANVAACLDTVLENLGTQTFVASIISNQGIDVRKEVYVPEPIYFGEYKNDTAGSVHRRFEMPIPESGSDRAKVKQLESFFVTGIRTSKRDQMLTYLSEKVVEIFEKATAE